VTRKSGAEFWCAAARCRVSAEHARGRRAAPARQLYSCLARRQRQSARLTEIPDGQSRGPDRFATSRAGATLGKRVTLAHFTVIPRGASLSHAQHAPALPLAPQDPPPRPAPSAPPSQPSVHRPPPPTRRQHRTVPSRRHAETLTPARCPPSPMHARGDRARRRDADDAARTV
jgi:hypothetical protein